jgi:hypothetical protein
MSPTQRSLKYLREAGHHAEVVEKWNPYARIRQDLFGFIDIVSMDGEKIYGVQTTSYSNMGARVKKIVSSDLYHIAIASGWNIHVHGWKKNKKNRWEVKITEL